MYFKMTWWQARSKFTNIKDTWQSRPVSERIRTSLNSWVLLYSEVLCLLILNNFGVKSSFCLAFIFKTYMYLTVVWDCIIFLQNRKVTGHPSSLSSALTCLLSSVISHQNGSNGYVHIKTRFCYYWSSYRWKFDKMKYF